jgi:hypothetical protein
MSELALQDSLTELILDDGETETIIADSFIATGMPIGYTVDFTTNLGFITYFLNGTAIKKIRLLDL